MSEAELIESAVLLGEAALHSASLYLTCVSAYLVAAYAVGAKLTLFQVSVVNVLFIVFAVSFLMAVQTNVWNMYHLSADLSELRPLWVRYTSPAVIWGLLVIDSAGVAASLAFMWSVRHPRGK